MTALELLRMKLIYHQRDLSRMNSGMAMRISRWPHCCCCCYCCLWIHQRSHRSLMSLNWFRANQSWSWTLGQQLEPEERQELMFSSECWQARIVVEHSMYWWGQCSMNQIWQVGFAIREMCSSGYLDSSCCQTRPSSTLMWSLMRANCFHFEHSNCSELVGQVAVGDCSNYWQRLVVGKAGHSIVDSTVGYSNQPGLVLVEFGLQPVASLA